MLVAAFYTFIKNQIRKFIYSGIDGKSQILDCPIILSPPIIIWYVK
jgi:hypothetical protein